MKLLVITFICWVAALPSMAQCHIIGVGNSGSLTIDSAFPKKMLVIMLPLQKDTAVINQLQRFQQKHKDSLQVLGLIAVSGVQVTTDSVSIMYAAAIAAGIMVSDSITVTGNGQWAAMLQWLMDKNNQERTVNPALVNSKYLLSKRGRMYASFDKNASLDFPVVNNVARAKIPGEN